MAGIDGHFLLEIDMHWKDPIFEIGETIICKGNRGIHWLTENKKYVVIKYEPETPDDFFTWPAYVHIINDNNKAAIYHANRFIKES